MQADLVNLSFNNQFNKLVNTNERPYLKVEAPVMSELSLGRSYLIIMRINHTIEHNFFCTIGNTHIFILQ